MKRSIHRYLSELGIKENKEIANSIYYILGDNLSKHKVVKLSEELRKRGTARSIMKLIRSFLGFWEYAPPNLKIKFATLLFLKSRGHKDSYDLRLIGLTLKFSKICEEFGDTTHFRLIHCT